MFHFELDRKKAACDAGSAYNETSIDSAIDFPEILAREVRTLDGQFAF